MKRSGPGSNFEKSRRHNLQRRPACLRKHRHLSPFKQQGPSAFAAPVNPFLNRPPDQIASYQLYPMQGLIYRLTGDFGPPNANARMGYPTGMNLSLIHI